MRVTNAMGRKLLACVWLRGHGCRHFRSHAMTEVEAENVLEALRKEERQGFELDRPSKIELASGDGAVFLLAKQLSDPNHPGRTVTEFRAILYGSPREGADADSVLFELFEAGSCEPGAWRGWREVGSSAGRASRASRSGRNTGASGRPGVGRRPGMRVPRVLTCGCLMVCVGTSFLVFALRSCSRPEVLSPDSGATGSSSTPSSVPAIPDDEWEAARREIIKHLRPRHQGSLSDESPEELLRKFFALFRRPTSLDMGGAEGWGPYQHPFKDFFDTLFRDPPEPARMEPGQDAGVYVRDELRQFIDERLRLRKETLEGRKLGERVKSGLVGEFNSDARRLRDAHPLRRQVEALAVRLNYPDFYEEWKDVYENVLGRKNPPRRDCSDLDDRGGHEWQKGVRQILKDKYGL